MENIETLLYKVLIATEPRGSESKSNDGGVCLPMEYFSKTKDCINIGDTMCTSINLRTSEADCYECVQCNDTVIPCKQYVKLKHPINFPGLNITPDGSMTIDINEFKENLKYDASPPKCVCAWPQYYCANISNNLQCQFMKDAGNPEMLQCQCDDISHHQLYCTVGGVATCYERDFDCSFEEDTINCTTHKYDNSTTGGTTYNLTIDELNECSRWKTILKDREERNLISFNDAVMGIIHNLTDGKNLVWNDVRDNQISISSTCHNSFANICDENFNLEKCTIINQTSSPSTQKPVSGSTNDTNLSTQDSGKSTGAITWLIIIIITLVISFLLYVGYQNHQKVVYYMYLYLFRLWYVHDTL